MKIQFKKEFDIVDIHDFDPNVLALTHEYYEYFRVFIEGSNDHIDVRIIDFKEYLKEKTTWLALYTWDELMDVENRKNIREALFDYINKEILGAGNMKELQEELKAEKQRTDYLTAEVNEYKALYQSLQPQVKVFQTSKVGKIYNRPQI